MWLRIFSGVILIRVRFSLCMITLEANLWDVILQYIPQCFWTLAFCLICLCVSVPELHCFNFWGFLVFWLDGVKCLPYYFFFFFQSLFKGAGQRRLFSDFCTRNLEYLYERLPLRQKQKPFWGFNFSYIEWVAYIGGNFVFKNILNLWFRNWYSLQYFNSFFLLPSLLLFFFVFWVFLCKIL